MALVYYHTAQVVKGQITGKTHALCGGAQLVQPVPQDLLSHHNDVSVRAELDVACHDAHSGGRVLGLELCKLLVGQGLDGGGVEHALALGQAVLDHVQAHCSLAAASLGCHQHVLVPGDGHHAPLLKLVQRVGEELLAHIVGRGKVWAGLVTVNLEHG